VQDPKRIEEFLAKAEKELLGMKRQTMVSRFFQMDRLVVEGGKEGKEMGGGRKRVKDTGWD